MNLVADAFCLPLQMGASETPFQRRCGSVRCRRCIWHVPINSARPVIKCRNQPQVKGPNSDATPVVLALRCAGIGVITDSSLEPRPAQLSRIPTAAGRNTNGPLPHAEPGEGPSHCATSASRRLMRPVSAGRYLSAFERRAFPGSANNTQPMAQPRDVWERWVPRTRCIFQTRRSQCASAPRRSASSSWPPFPGCALRIPVDLRVAPSRSVRWIGLSRGPHAGVIYGRCPRA